jgi:hypothetical protein
MVSKSPQTEYLQTCLLDLSMQFSYFSYEAGLQLSKTFPIEKDNRIFPDENILQG